MPSPFPGMDPYLENPAIWPDVHHEIISEARAQMNALLRPAYVARVELRIYVSGDDDTGRGVLFPGPEDAATIYVPDVHVEHTNGSASRRLLSAPTAVAAPVTYTVVDDEIEEAYIAVREPRSEKLVTVIEVLSPSNKVRASAGRESFRKKRREVLAMDANWVEIDLLRAGIPTYEILNPPKSDYRVLANRSETRNEVKCWPIDLRQELPTVAVPLRGKEEIGLDLSKILKSVYERGAYDMSIDYAKPPVPPLRGKDAAWAKQVIRKAKRRSPPS